VELAPQACSSPSQAGAVPAVPEPANSTSKDTFTFRMAATASKLPKKPRTMLRSA
jgi:hypothetical protein